MHEGWDLVPSLPLCVNRPLATPKGRGSSCLLLRCYLPYERGGTGGVRTRAQVFSHARCAVGQTLVPKRRKHGVTQPRGVRCHVR